MNLMGLDVFLLALDIQHLDVHLTYWSNICYVVSED